MYGISTVMTCHAMDPFLCKIFILLSLLQLPYSCPSPSQESFEPLSQRIKIWFTWKAPIKDSLVSSKLVCGQWNIRLYLSSCPLLCSVTRWARCYWRHLPGECQSASAASSGRWTNQRPGAGRDSQSEAGDWGNVRDEGGGERLTSGRWTHGDTSLVCQSHGWDTESRWTPGRTLCGDPSALGAATTGWSPG